MVSNSGFSGLGKIYLWAVISAGTYAICRSLHLLYLEPIGYQWFILAALTLVSGSATVKLPSSYASISISETFVYTAVLLYGPAAGTLIVALDGLVISFWISKRHDQIHKALFNMSAPAISAWLSANLFFRVAQIEPLVKAPAPLETILPALILFALTYFGLNSWLITIVIALERKLDPLKVWTTTFVWLSLNYFGGASVAILFVGYNRTIDLGYIGAIVPLLLVLWLTFKTTMGRVEDADRHVEQLNKLYLSTIETLAMAIDAKDQVTHGHIRRVQLHAVALARSLGVPDGTLLKAIEAAALLHDMGKLAVPEYILNKPGKLTSAEFEKMKLHASVGADILSAIDFPYPVVPIVRHHHEHWDGNGYPDGLRGTDIPIGARILSVVDCFDALTSDRPYRARLSDADAIQILRDRRGSMYDPLIVDTFIRVHKEVPAEPVETRLSAAALSDIASARTSLAPQAASRVFDDIAAGADEMLTLYELVHALRHDVLLANAGDIVAQYIRRIVPSQLCILFLLDRDTAELKAAYVEGQGASAVKGLRFPVGQRLSGWVAANRQTIINSDPILDLGVLADAVGGNRPRSCLSTAIVFEDVVVGVLSLYSDTSSSFDDDHLRLVEAIAQHIAPVMQPGSAYSISTRDQLTGLPSITQLELLVSGSHSTPSNFGILVVDIVGLREINKIHGRRVGDDAIKHVARFTRGALRVGDILFRAHNDAFVVLLTAPDVRTTPMICYNIRQAVTGRALPLSIGNNLTIDVTVTVAVTPDNSPSLAAFLETINRLTHTDHSLESRVH